MINDRDRLSHPAPDRSAWLRRRSSVAGAVDPDETQSGTAGRVGDERRLEPVARSAMAPKDSRLIARAVVGETNGATVCRRNRSVLHESHSSDESSVIGLSTVRALQ